MCSLLGRVSRRGLAALAVRGQQAQTAPYSYRMQVLLLPRLTSAHGSLDMKTLSSSRKRFKCSQQLSCVQNSVRR